MYNYCGKYTLLFNNISFEFSQKQLLLFRDYIYNLDVDYWMTYYSETTRKRKIPISTLHENLVLYFT